MNTHLKAVYSHRKQIIVAFSGHKQSGKDTLSNYLCDYFRQFVSEPHEFIRIYSFADLIKKNICIDVLGLSYEQCYGTDEQKNTPTKYKWEDMFIEIRDKNSVIDPTEEYYREYKHGYMTGREIMQVIGTDIFRDRFNKDIWVDATINKIKSDGCTVAIINDTRFKSEVDKLAKEDAFIFRLTRQKESTDMHQSEIDLDYYDWSIISNNRFCLVDNKEMSKEEQFSYVLNFLHKNL